MDIASLSSRLAGVVPNDFCPGGVGILTTQRLPPPEEFQAGWMVIDNDFDAQSAFRVLSPFPVFLVFSDLLDKEQQDHCCRFLANLPTLGLDDRHVIYVPHCASSGGLENELFHQSKYLAASERVLNADVDAIVQGEPEGFNLVLAVRARLAVANRFLRIADEAFDSQQQIADFAEQSANVIDETLWMYLPMRLRIQLPQENPNITPEEPSEVGLVTVGAIIGKGRFSHVHKAINRTIDKTHALKAIPKGKIQSVRDLSNLHRHISNMELLSSETWSHPNIVKLNEAHISQTHIYFIMEYAGPENLRQRLQSREDSGATCRPLSLDSAKSIISQFFNALMHMHLGPKIAHLDIEPGNIIVLETKKKGIKIQIADFDMCTTEAQVSHARRGTFPFMAPEVLLKKKSYSAFPADMWSTGVLLLEIAFRVSFFKRRMLEQKGNNTQKDMMKAMVTNFENPSHIGNLLRTHLRAELQELQVPLLALLSGMLQVGVAQRWSAEDLKTALNKGLSIALAK